MDESKSSAGGKARAKALTKEQRRQIAVEAAAVRWGKEVPEAMAGSPDHPLRIGSLEIPCYVLDDERRVLVQGGMLTALDIKQGTAGKGTGDRLSKLVQTKGLSQYVSPQLAEMITKPILFRANGRVAYGYEATILADLCEAVLAARKAGVLNYQQDHIAEQCEILMRGFARVGIVALVDEATGFQSYRQRDALAAILEKFVQTELRKWVRTFPPEYFENLCRLKDIPYPPANMKMPQYVGHFTNDLVYDRLAPGVRQELKRITPKDGRGRHKDKLFQRLTDEVGVPRLREHLSSVITLMKISRTWDDFYTHMQKALPKWEDQIQRRLGLE